MDLRYDCIAENDQNGYPTYKNCKEAVSYSPEFKITD